jgi:hypothetical protein
MRREREREREKKKKDPGKLLHACNPSTWEAEAEGLRI